MTFSVIFRALAFAPAILALALALHGCGGGTPIGSNRSGDVRLVNATLDQGALDLYDGETRIASAVGTESAGGYADVSTGSRTLSLRKAADGTQIASTTADVSRDAHYAVLAYTSAGAPASALLTEDEAAPADGNAKVRVFNAAAADAGSLSVYLSATSCSAIGASNAVATSVDASKASAYVTVGAAAGGTRYRLCVTASGDTSDLRLELPSFTLTSRQVTTVVLTGAASGVLVNSLLVDQQGAATAQRNPSARVRLVADAAAGATVSAAVGSVVLDAGTSSPTVGSYATVPAGTLAATASIGGQAVTVGEQAAAPGADFTLLVAGSAAAPKVVWLADDNRPSTATASPVRLRLVHGLNGLAGTLTLQANARNIASGVTFGSASTPVNVASGLTPFSVTTPGAIGALYATTSSNADTLASGGVYTLFLLGNAGAPFATLQRDR